MQKTILAKFVPFVGVPVGAAWNFIEVERQGTRVIRYFQKGSL